MKGFSDIAKRIPTKSVAELERELGSKSDFEIAYMLESQLIPAMLESVGKIILLEAIRRLREAD